MPVRGCEGIFIKTATGYDINPNAKQLISYYLFDGSKSTTMVKLLDMLNLVNLIILLHNILHLAEVLKK